MIEVFLDTLKLKYKCVQNKTLIIKLNYFFYLFIYLYKRRESFFISYFFSKIMLEPNVIYILL